MGAVAPDLTIISIGVNDAFGSIAATTLQSNVQAMITAAKASGDVLLLGCPPLQNTTANGFVQAYEPVYAGLAATNNCAFLSSYGRFGGAYNAAFNSGDGTHFNDQGNWDWAQFVAGVVGAP